MLRSESKKYLNCCDIQEEGSVFLVDHMMALVLHVPPRKVRHVRAKYPEKVCSRELVALEIFRCG